MKNKDLDKDLYRYSGEEYRKFVTVLTNSGASFMFLFRMCQKYEKKTFLGLFFRLWILLFKRKNGVEIPHSCGIKGGLYLGHFKNITINQHVLIGENCNVAHGVTLGRESRGRRKGCPVIEDKVSIGPNAVIVGRILTGSDSLIAPLSYVNFDVPPNSVVLGNPAKIISSKGSVGYVNTILED